MLIYFRKQYFNIFNISTGGKKTEIFIALCLLLLPFIIILFISIFLFQKSLPEISRIGEMLALTKLISEAQKKLKSKLSEEFVAVSYNFLQFFIVPLELEMAQCRVPLNLQSQGIKKIVRVKV